MFDYYGMPEDWPGRAQASSRPWEHRAAFVEQMVSAEIQKQLDDRFNPQLFIPYVQLHEFEALAFAKVETLVEVVSPLHKGRADHLLESFQKILKQAGAPEAINDSYETCPSRRILKLVPAYTKTAQGPIVTGRIGIETLRQRCPHFASWLSRLEQLNT